jgi:general secretion pathway protein N
VTLDTRNNLLSVLLIGAIGVLVLVGLASFWLFGRPDVAAIDPAGRTPAVVDRAVADNPELAELSAYDTIVERPVFFADRRLPVMEVAAEGEAEPEPEPAVAAAETPPLEASVAGIIITPEMKLAMVTDRSSNETLVLREGMALAGEKSAWKVARIRPRGVRFETDGGDSEEVELEVETAALKAGTPPAQQRAAAVEQSQQRAAQAEEQADAQTDAQAEARARAEEIRRRVAERRAQLRAEAERRARENNDG